MPLNLRGGNKTKKQKRSRKIDIYTEVEEEQLFGKIIQNMGGHFVVQGTDGIKRLGKLKNSVKKGPRINKDSFVAFSLRNFNDKNECDIIGIARPSQNIIEVLTSFEAKKKTSDIQFNYDSDDNEFKNLDKVKVTKDNCDYFNTDYLDDNNNDDDDDDYDENIKNSDNENNIYENENDNINFDDLCEELNKEEYKNTNKTNNKKNNLVKSNNNCNNDKNECDEINKNECDEINFDNINFDDI
jgi:translation initiation factor IF-1